MALTGILLWAVNYTLAWLPKQWLDIATAVHFYEAILATLSIVVWHFTSSYSIPRSTRWTLRS